jgi:hypothetical protein
MTAVRKVAATAIGDLESGQRSGEQGGKGFLGVQRARVEDVDVPDVEQPIGTARA